MRTTIEIPDDLFREAKSQAALRGQTLKEFVEEGIRMVLRHPPAPRPTRVSFPLLPAGTRKAISVDEVRDFIHQAEAEEDLRHASLD